MLGRRTCHDEYAVQCGRSFHRASAKSFDVRPLLQRNRELEVLNVITGLLKLSDETDIDLLNSSMESMVEQFQDELLPVATELTSRLVGGPCCFWWRRCRLLTRGCGKCESYLRLAREGLAQTSESNLDNVDVDTLLDSDEDKVYGAMGVAKTISTVSLRCAGH